MSIRVAVDGGALAYPETGIGRYTGELLMAMVGLPESAEGSERGVDLRVFFNHRGVARPAAPYALPAVPVINPRLPSRVLRFAWDRLGWPPVERWSGPIDVFHASDWIHPARATAALAATVHDLGPLDRPDWYSEDVVSMHRRINESVARNAAVIFTVSDYTRRRFAERFSVPLERIRVTYNGAAAGFRPSERVEVSRCRAAHGLARPYVLYVGSRERRKNVVGLIEVFARLAGEDPALDLVLIGMRPQIEGARVQGVSAWSGDALERAIDRHGLRERVRILGRVDRSDLVALYSGGEALVYPTLYEGFGIPIVEAMACGLPVVASNRTAVPEVVGGAGVVADPEDVDAFASAVLGVIGDDGERERLRAAGLQRAGDFTWAAAARRTVDGYRAAAGPTECSICSLAGS